MNNDQTVLITGACGTIGSATAALLNQRGYKLILVDKDKNNIESLSKKYTNCESFAVDVTNGDEMDKLFESVSSQLTSVVLAVGTEGPVGTLENCSYEDFQYVMLTNITSTWLGLKNSLRILKQKKKGNIVVLSSISGVTAMPMLGPYCASKHAVMGLVRTAAREAANSGVRINAVCPGPVESEMMNRIDQSFLSISPHRPKASASIPLQRYATPEDVAKMIAFLCSDESAFCTGAAMMVDGGITCR